MEIWMNEKIPSGIEVIKEWIALDVNMVYRLIDVKDPAALLKQGVFWGSLGYTEMHPVMESGDAMKLMG